MDDTITKALRQVSAATNVLAARADSVLENQQSGLGTSEDAAIAARPVLKGRLTDYELDVLYMQDDLARRIVEEIVDDAFRQGFEVKTLDEENPEIVEEPEHLDIVTALREAGYAARRTGTGAVALIFDQNTDSELEPDAGEPVALLVLDRGEIDPSEFDPNPKSANFARPLRYHVSPNNNSGATLDGSPEFHHTRILRLKGAPLPGRLRHLSNDWDDSVLQAVWPSLRNFKQTEDAIANIIQRFEVATYSITGLADILDGESGSAKILQRLQLLQQTVSMVRAVVIDKDAGEEYSRAFSAVNGLDTLWDRLAHSVAKAARMPMTQLFGMSPSGLATDDQSGRANWRKQVASYQDTVLTPLLERYFRLLNGGKPVQIIWNPLDEATAKEEAEISKLRAETRDLYVGMGAATPEEFRPAMQKEGLIEAADNPDFEAEPEMPLDGELPVPREPDEFQVSRSTEEELPAPVDAGDKGYEEETEPPAEDPDEEPV